MMGVVSRDAHLVLRYLLFRRTVPWGEVDRFSLEPLRGGRALYLYTTSGRKLTVPAGQFAGPRKKESWLRTHRLVWRGGESHDVLGVLNGIIAEHRGLPTG
jgi:Bacterial PH domain